MTGYMRKVLLGAAAIILLSASHVAAQSTDLKLKRTFGYRGDGESHVQMRPMLLPVQRPKSISTVNIPVTPVLTVLEKDKVGHVCKLGPRITDALLRACYDKPITLDQMFDVESSSERDYRTSKSPAQEAEDARLVGAINKVLGEDLVSEILVVKGMRKSGGGGISKLPFASLLGCAELETKKPEAEEKPAH